MLTRLSLAVAATMGALALVALGMSQPLAAGAAALCGLLFFVPGLFFLNETRRAYLRDAALAHAGRVAEARGVTDAEALGMELHVPRDQAEKILRKAIQEGHARGSLDDRGRFVAADAPRCPSCEAPLPREPQRPACPACGAALAPVG